MFDASPLSARPTFVERFATSRNARERTIEIDFPFPDHGGPPPGSVLAQRVTVSEALSTPFEVVVHALADPHWYHRTKDGKHVHAGTKAHPEEFIGYRARVVVRAEGHERRFDGIVTGTRQLGHWDVRNETDVRFQLLELVIRPGLALFAHRRTCRIFHRISPIEVVKEVLLEHQKHNVGVAGTLGDLRGAMPNPVGRSYLTQYKESDLDFVQRLIASEGLHYVLTDEDERFGHRMELITPRYRLRGEPDLILHGDGRADADGLPLRHWQGRRQLGIARTRLSSSNYAGQPLDADLKGRDLNAFRSTHGPFGEYLPLSPNARPTGEEQPRGAFAFRCDAEWRQYAHDAEAEYYEGETVAPLSLTDVIRVDGLEAHRQTRLEKNPEEIRRDTPFDYVVIAQTLVAHAPLHADLHQRLAGDLDDLDHRAGIDLFGRKDTATGPRVRASFRALPREQPLAPDPARLIREAPGALTGRVIGYPGAEDPEVCTDELGRIGVVLDWQRPTDYRSANTSYHYEDGEPITWLRYVQPGAGHGIGFQYLPRVGDEVLVQFLNDDPDRPIAIGSLYSPRHHPPRFGGVGALPGNAALTGLRTREHRGSGSNELCLDDSQGEVGLRLASSTADTALTLGHIATPRDKGKASHRGTGAELRTEGAAALRAAQGLLLTTFQAAKGESHLAHTELSELIARCHELTETLAAAVAQAGAVAPVTDASAHVRSSLPSWDAPGPKSESVPLIAIGSPHDIVTATALSHVTYAGKDVDVAADGRIQHTSGGRLNLTAGEKLSLFAADEGLEALAARGPVKLRANDGDIVAEARQSVMVTATEGKVRITAPEIELIASDGSYVRIGNGVEWGSPKVCRVHAPEWKVQKAARAEAPTYDTTTMTTDQRIRAIFCNDSTGDRHHAVDKPLHATLDDGNTTEGITDSAGRSEVVTDTLLRAFRASIPETFL